MSDLNRSDLQRPSGNPSSSQFSNEPFRPKTTRNKIKQHKDSPSKQPLPKNLISSPGISRREPIVNMNRMSLNNMQPPPIQMPHASDSTRPVIPFPYVQSTTFQQPHRNEPVDLRQNYMAQVSAFYSNNNSRYLENLSFHPQFQYNNMYVNAMLQKNQQMPPSMYNYAQPIAHNMPLRNSDPTSPRYLQNVMQHPLLNQIYSNSRQTPPNISPLQNTSTSKKERPKKGNQDQCKFENYMSVEEVEKGLKENVLTEGVLRINPKQYQHSYIASQDKSLQDILIDGIQNRNRALEGDVVVVQLINYIEKDDSNKNNAEEICESEDTKQKKGKVVFIKEKVHPRTCIGNIKLMPDKNKQRALFIPRDYRIPRLNIPFSSWPDNFYQDAEKYENTLFLAKILDWFDKRFALGTIIQNIGLSGDMIVESKAILAQNDIDISPFDPAVRELFPRSDYIIPEEEIKLREDCRQSCIFSIDPFNCRDIDDAMSCKRLDNGNYEIGVHISDVSHFLAESTILDEKVAEKATTVYMVERAYHMLPDEMCTLCSLFPGVDKLAFSVFWEITQDAKVLSHRFSKTVINSCSQLAYDHALAVLDDKPNAKDSFPEIYNGFTYEDIQTSIKVLGSISSRLRKERFENGALRIDQPKVAFHLNPSNGLPDSYWIYESKESHQLIEEFMLLANMTVATKIYEDHPKLAFLRCHPSPSAFMLQQLAKSLKPMGIDLDISSAGTLHNSLLPHVESTQLDKGKAMVLNMLCAKPMTRAKYFCTGGCDSDEDFHHYALNVPLYTHFTSPIRRYADIMVHRLLAASLKYREVPNWPIDKVRMIAANCNKQKYNAKRAGEMSTELYTLKYIEMNSPVITEAVVVDIKQNNIDVIVVAMSLNRRIFFNSDFPGEHKCSRNESEFRLSKMELTWSATPELPEIKQDIQVFSMVQVEMYKGDDMVKVETKLLRPTQDNREK